MIAQLLPFERNKVEPNHSRKTFVEGYEAYQRRDYVAAIERMQLAARSMTGLAGYAAYYPLARRSDANGDEPGAAAQAFDELTFRNYPRA